MGPSADRLDLLRATTVYSTQEERIEYLVLLRRHRAALIVIFFLCLLGGALYALFAPKSYKAETILEITGVNEDFMNTRDVDVKPGTAGVDSYLETQIDLLQTPSVIDRVVSIMAPKVPPALASDSRGREAFIGKILSSAKAKEQGQSDLVRITLTGPDPKLVAATANELTNQYIQQGEDARLAVVAGTGKFLTQQLGEAKKKLQDSEDAMQQFARASGIVLTEDGRESVDTEHLRQIQQGLAQAEVDRANREAEADIAQHAPAEHLPQVVDDPATRDDLARIADLRRQLADLSTTMTPANYKVQQVEAQIKSLQADLGRQRSTIVSRLSVEDQAAIRRQQLLKQEYAQQLAVVTDQGGKQVRFDMLRHEADVNRLVYQSLLQKVNEAGVMTALRAPSASVVSPAIAPILPSSPKLIVCGLLSVLLGAVLSLLYILISERKDNSVRNPGESGQHVECPELAVIPRNRLGAKTSKARFSLNNGSGAEVMHPMLEHWRRADKTFMAEAYRSAVTSILFSKRDGIAPKVLLVTSPHPQCGKTITTANLAVSLAEGGGRRVLLIDGDLRRPALPQLFGVENREGLSNTLDEEERADPETLIQATGFHGVSILPSGNIKGSVAKLLHSSCLGSVVEAARSEFDYVLIDAPPLLGLADARLLGKYADGLILVCRAGYTSVDDLEEARRLLMEDGTYILGTILNDYDLQREKSSHYSSYLTYVGNH